MGEHEASERMKNYDGRYGDAEPAGDPDNDEAYAPGTAKDMDLMSGHLRAQGQSGPTV
jgi:hypothetical protein